MPASHREHVFGSTRSDFLWCSHCERTYGKADFAEVRDGTDVWQMCHYDDCDADAVLDARDWDEIRMGHPAWPESPVAGVIYSLYP